MASLVILFLSCNYFIDLFSFRESDSLLLITDGLQVFSILSPIDEGDFNYFLFMMASSLKIYIFFSLNI